MAESEPQKRITGRVMHEFKHGELKSGRGGKAGTVKNRRQVIAIALEEAGATKGAATAINATSAEPSRKKQRAGPDSRSARKVAYRRITQTGKHPCDGRKGCPKADRKRCRRRQPLARGTRTAIPARNLTQRLSSNTSKAAQK